MTSNFEIGQILDGKVTGIQPYGAFVALDEETQGLVHISEVTHGYVKDINDHLTIGDDVKVKVLQIDEEKNKVSLSIRATQDTPQAKPKQVKPKQVEVEPSGFNTLKDKLEEWMKQSNYNKK
ncbi:RNA-binding protein S1 [Virgibacillus dokdonensis]|uniref:RNA-binding protein S1 n=1 Tax=Virgibacillus dokdonensis TaxID=302167 RepID=A0A3E0WVE6_9BACI|nr:MULTISPECIES: S1 domain-containing post-transcriptional regulator GSP13 [Virgibacillus]RFA36962.1 RNA-binding protein S1 [Virgibacillus dokdonensis]